MGFFPIGPLSCNMNLLKYRITLQIGLALLTGKLSAQALEIRHVEPMHWWTGMKDKNLQLLIHGKELKGSTVQIRKGETGLKIKKVHSSPNPNYLFVDLEVQANAKAGLYHLELKNGSRSKILDYPLKARSEMAAGAKGYGPEDVLYLIMPDRFANGNPANDDMPGCLEKANRNEESGRHGGDLAGIEQHLDYIKNFGATTIWINPVLENNQPHYSYHGYAFTDFYKIDSRFGTLEDYKRLIRKTHDMGMKMVQDMVANHIGSKHWWLEDMPEPDWLHPAGDPFNRCNFRIETIPDPYASRYDSDKMLKGWFDNHMADVNQRNPKVARYLIQNSIWWIAETGIDGIRMDTYPYNYKEFMSDWCTAILREFPAFSLVGEVWVDQPALSAYFIKGAKNQDGYVAGLPTSTDFPLYSALTKGLMEKGTWDNGVQRIYNTLAQDFLYKDPSRQLIFADNHDLSRFMTIVKNDLDRFKQGMGMVLTLRGVPQLYYGAEIAMDGDGKHHPDVRKDFPGGWAGDPVNAFEPSGRKGKADSVFRFMNQLLQWRKTSNAVTKGRFLHFLPDSNVYTYFRTYNQEKVMVVVNGNDKQTEADFSRFTEILPVGGLQMREVISGQSMLVEPKKTKIPAKGIWILELKP